MKPQYFLSILFIQTFFICAFGQDFILKGKIVDSKTSEALSFATIEIRSVKTGTVADINGDFTISAHSIDLTLDSIEFSYLGYNKLKISINDFKNINNSLVKLNEEIVKLKEIVVFPKKYKLIKQGVTAKKNDKVQFASVFSGNLGSFIENTKQKNGFIKSVSFYIGEDGHPETPFRIRIFGVDKIKGCPGEDILRDNITVTPAKSGWFNFDISNYHIPFSIKGAYVMMEWINSGEQFYFDKEFVIKGPNGEKDKKETRRFYGQTLGSITKQSKMLTWGRGLGNDWIQYNQNYKGYLNVMISAEITIPKD